MSSAHFLSLKKLFIAFREEGRDRETERGTSILLFYLFMHSLIAPFMCPDWGLNPQPWRVGAML